MTVSAFHPERQKGNLLYPVYPVKPKRVQTGFIGLIESFLLPYFPEETGKQQSASGRGQREKGK